MATDLVNVYLGRKTLAYTPVNVFSWGTPSKLHVLVKNQYDKVTSTCTAKKCIVMVLVSTYNLVGHVFYGCFTEIAL